MHGECVSKNVLCLWSSLKIRPGVVLNSVLIQCVDHSKGMFVTCAVTYKDHPQGTVVLKPMASILTLCCR